MLKLAFWATGVRGQTLSDSPCLATLFSGSPGCVLHVLQRNPTTVTLGDGHIPYIAGEYCHHTIRSFQLYDTRLCAQLRMVSNGVS
jgi:hypothetical protein